MSLKRITAPANDPVTLAEAKAQLRVEHTDHDDLITAMISASTEYVDGPKGFLGRALIVQTWDLYLDAFPVDQIVIPLPPLISVTGVYYQDADAVEQTFSTADYVVDTASEPGRVVLTASGSWPTTVENANAVRVRFVAGYQDAGDSPPSDDVPYAIKAAIMINVANLYRHRETMVIGERMEMLPWSAEQLLRRYRVHLGFA